MSQQATVLRRFAGAAIISMALTGSSAGWADVGIRDCWKTPGPDCVDLSKDTKPRTAGKPTASQAQAPKN